MSIINYSILIQSNQHNLNMNQIVEDTEHFYFRTFINNLAVSSIRFLNNFILAGIGGCIFIFDTSSPDKLRRKIEMFDNSVIHGTILNPSNSRICVFGGRNVAILSTCLDLYNSRLTVEWKWRFSDWVLSCQWAGRDDHVAILSAHNILSLWNCTGEKLAQVSCAQKCILYSATILSKLGWSDTLVLAGTVFQQISVWAVTSEASQESPIIHQLTGHKGVIFSVKYDKRSRMISSTSDDRSVRVWSVSSPKVGDLTVDDWIHASVTLTLTVFGHTARVWQSHILADKKMISVGEDSLLCLWDAGGKCISQQETHQGAGVWCMDVSEDLSLVVTGGVDGGISLWPLNLNPPASSGLPSPRVTPRRVVLLEDSRPLVYAETGSIMYYVGDDWTPVFTDERISSYCLLETSPSKQLVSLATIHGHIIVLKSGEFSTIVDVEIGKGRIFSLHWLDEDTILCCQNEGKLSIWKLKDFHLEPVGKVYLPPCKERWTTSSVLIGLTVIYGDRGGNIHISPITHSHDAAKEAVQTIPRAHSKQGVCTLKVLNGYVWSSGRDGTVKQFIVSNHSLTMISSLKLPVEWLVYISCTNIFGPVVIAFHEANVELWSLREMRRLMCFPCGGGHRFWSCSVEEDKFSFTYLKDKTAHLLQCSLLQIARPFIKEGFHPKEINSMARLSESWVASGGEDGSVRLSTLCGECWTTPVVQNIHVSSVRAVHVQFFKQHTLLFSAGARAQMKVWKISLNSPISMTELNSVMLREEKRGRHWLNSVPELDPDTRYMDVHAVQKSDSIICILAACSDAYLRIFHYNFEKNHIVLKHSVRNSQYCLLRVSSFTCTNGVIVIVATGTNGFVTFWDIGQDPPEVVYRERLHKSGVNGLSVVAKERLVLVATGGDDSQLVLTCFLVTSISSPVVLHKVTSWACSSLHSSVITGVQIIGEWVLCCGGDQRLSLLTWKLTGETLSVEILSQKCCSVPDIKGVSVLQFDGNKLTACVYGAGLEVISLFRKKR